MRFNFLAALLAFAVVSVSTGFVAPPTTLRSSQMAMRASSFTSSISPATRGPYAAVSRQRRPVRGDLRMGKVSTFGIFSPAVVAAKIVLGETRLNKIRGKAIALHSQVITEYCTWVGASQKMRGLLIRKAKLNGDMLGFLW